MQITTMRKYKNNYGYTYGRITLDADMTDKFLGVKETSKILVKYDEEKDCLIIEKIKEDKNKNK